MRGGRDREEGEREGGGGERGRRGREKEEGEREGGGVPMQTKQPAVVIVTKQPEQKGNGE